MVNPFYKNPTNLENKTQLPEKTLQNKPIELETNKIFEGVAKKNEPVLHLESQVLESRSVKMFTGTPDFDYVKPQVEIPQELRVVLNADSLNALEKECLEEYGKAVEALEDSIADAAVKNRETQELIQKAAERAFFIVEKYVEIMAEENNLSLQEAELTVYKLLADTYYESPKTQDYAGNVGSNPLAIKKVIKEGNLREQLFLLLNFKKTILGKIITNPDLVEKINKKITSAREQWQIKCDVNLDGLYSLQTEALKLRAYENKSKEWKASHNPTLEQGDQLRIPASEREKRYTTGEPKITEKEAKKQFNWNAGAALFTPATAPNNLYLEAAEKLHLKLVAGISGSTDQMLSILNDLGFDSIREMLLGRIACLAWFIDSQSHSAYEVMTSAKSFNLDFIPTPDFYKQIDPIGTSFEEDLEKAQSERGYRMPEYYLKAVFVTEKAQKYLDGSAPPS